MSSPGCRRFRARGVSPGKQVEFAERDPARGQGAGRRHRVQLDDGVERRQCHGEIGGMGRDAMLAAAEHREQAVVALDRRAARARGAACCTETRCRGNSRSGCAATDCRPSSPCCAIAARRWRAAPRRSAAIAGAARGGRRPRSSAPARRSARLHRRTRSGRAAAHRDRRGERGCSTSSFISCTRSVPPAMYLAPWLLRRRARRQGCRAWQA